VLRRRYNLSLKGMTLRDLSRVAAGLKLTTRALRAELGTLRKVRLPAILHWDHNHFVVLTSVGLRHIVIHDPAVGRRRIRMEEVDRRFTGIVLEAWPAQGFEQRTERARVRLFAQLRRTDGFWSAALRVLTMSLVLEAIVIAIPIGFQLVLDEAVVADDRDLLTLIVLALLLLLSFRAAWISCAPGRLWWRARASHCNGR
jgi:ATP-binding cassette, subfamily B, bacterial CvaB/MchF/RaxB